MCALKAIKSGRQNSRLLTYVSICPCMVEILATAFAVINLRVREVVARVLCFAFLVEYLFYFPAI